METTGNTITYLTTPAQRDRGEPVLPSVAIVGNMQMQPDVATGRNKKRRNPRYVNIKK
jgi:hypothetical protein